MKQTRKWMPLVAAAALSLSLAATPAQAAQETYTVKKGDTLWNVSQRFHTTPAAIKSLNSMKSDTVYIGQKMVINSGSTSAISGTPTTTQTGEVTASVLNVRSGAGTGYRLLFTLNRGSKVTILSESNGWMNISFNGSKGWVTRDFIKKVTTASTGTGTNTSTPTTPATGSKTYVVSGDYVNVRSGPSTSNQIINTLAAGTSIQVLQTSNGWSKVSYATGTGWMSSQYIREKTSTGSANGKLIVLDAGHGGVDPGALAKDGSKEEDLTLAIALKTQQALLNKGYRVIMVRSTDRSCMNTSSTATELQCRVNIAAANRANAYISIHINSAGAGARGTESYYNNTGNPHPSDSQRLASAIHRYFQPTFGSVNRGVHTANYYVLKRNTVPATLIEIGFITDPSDLAKMKSSTMQQNVSYSIAKGVDEFFGL